MSLTTISFLALFTIVLSGGPMDAPDFYDNFPKPSIDDCLNEDCSKRKYETINNILQSYELSNFLPYVNQEHKRKDSKQMDFYSGCACESINIGRDLGHFSYPRYLTTAVCQKSESKHQKCWTGSKCKEIQYTVRVLKNRSYDDKLDDQIPISLRNDWKFEDIKISVGCQCSIN